jgi:hypothetical protein
MKAHICRLSFLFALVAIFGFQTGYVPAGGQGKDDDIEKKLQAVRQQVEELRKQEQALLKQREKLKAEEAEREKMHIRVEIRGILRKVEQQFTNTHHWNVVVNDLTWIVNLGEQKEQLTAAEQLNGKIVVLTGKMITARNRNSFTAMPHATVVVESLRLAEAVKKD